MELLTPHRMFSAVHIKAEISSYKENYEFPLVNVVWEYFYNDSSFKVGQKVLICCFSVKLLPLLL